MNIPTAVERRSFMVLGAISTDGKSELVMFLGNVGAVRYQDEALQRSLLPFMNLHNRRMKFIQDVATPHTTKKSCIKIMKLNFNTNLTFVTFLFRVSFND